MIPSTLGTVLTLVLLAPAGGQEAEAADQERYGGTPPEFLPYRDAGPYRRFYATAPAYRGPGRLAPEPRDLASIKIGLLAPLEGTPDDSAGQSMERGVTLAIERANAAGGLGGVPFEIVVRNDQAIWGSSANTLVELAYQAQVWAVLGSIDSNSTHVALRVALKCEVPIINVGASDPTLTETGIPWIVRCTPDDRQVGYLLARRLFETEGLTRVAVLRSSDRYGRLGVGEFVDAARRLARPLPMEILFEPGSRDFTPQLERLRGARAQALVVWARAADAGRLVRQLRAIGFHQPVYGPTRLVSPELLRAGGPAVEGVRAAAWMDPRGPQGADWRGFRGSYERRFGQRPDVFAAYGYDAAFLVITKLREVGLNRARLRDALMDVRRYRGVTGPMRFDPTSNNLAPLVLVRVEGGRFVRD